MALRRFETSAEEIGLALSTLGVELVLCDLDDTYIDTVAVFREKERKAIRYIVSRSQHDLDGESIRTNIGIRIVQAHRGIGVAPVIWDEVARGLVDDFGSKHADLFVKGAQIIKEVYETVPDYHYGARKLAQTVAKVPVKRGIITHANKEWTDLKVKKRRIDHYFDKVVVVDEFGKKDEEAWARTIKSFGCDPRKVLAMGDNLNSDIRAAREAGVQNLIWVNRKSGWGEFKQGTVPEGVMVISNITWFMDALTQLQNKK